ncbi:MAG: metal ABC transporter permease [Alphaproteobacteria bacterium]|nr:metal ABC transporter permease [Alphaproteobacteria bacterium]
MIDLDLLYIVAPAIAVGLIVTAVHAPLGIEVLKRGIVFIDLATAQVVGLAIVALGLWFEEPSWLVRQTASFGTGVAVALFFRWIERKAPDEQEAVIGSSFILAASLALLVLADDPHGGEELRHVLSGQILFVSWSDIALFLPVYGLVAVLWIAAPRARSGTGFFVLFALAIGVREPHPSSVGRPRPRGLQPPESVRQRHGGGGPGHRGIGGRRPPGRAVPRRLLRRLGGCGPPAVLGRQRGLPDAARMNSGTGAVPAANSSPPNARSARFRRF